jgi:hypothetical protein
MLDDQMDIDAPYWIEDVVQKSKLWLSLERGFALLNVR